MNYFQDDEIWCRCCYLKYDTPEAQEHLQRMNLARHISQTTFKINSWTRCGAHNKLVGGSKTSSHLKGVASDISCTNSSKRRAIIYGLAMAGCRRILIYRNFIHADNDKNKSFGIWYKTEKSFR